MADNFIILPPIVLMDRNGQDQSTAVCEDPVDLLQSLLIVPYVLENLRADHCAYGGVSQAQSTDIQNRGQPMITCKRLDGEQGAVGDNDPASRRGHGSDSTSDLQNQSAWSSQEGGDLAFSQQKVKQVPFELAVTRIGIESFKA